MLKDGVLSALHHSGIMPAVRSLFAGPGAILMFHEIHRNVDNELRTGVAAQFLDLVVPWLRSAGWDIISLDEASSRLSSSSDRRSRFAVLTFDDGYIDNMACALPILERHRAPFTVYIPTSAIDRTLNSWWIGLRKIIQTHESIDMRPMDKRFRCVSLAEKVKTLVDIGDWIHRDYARIAELRALFHQHRISLPDLNEQYFLNEEQLKQFARSPLVTIGAHTVSHPALSLLDESTIHRGLTDNRNYLESLLQRPVRHFAYPYGNAGDREYAVAAKAGFETAVTTRNMPILNFSDKSFALPRLGISADTRLESLDAKISGLRDALLRRLPFH